ncbi:hypothetical protein BDV23DRAFT_188076 [Aspergillus alliaceus]|uniref:Uncharacterized protein n=1 Tax=Petromyces alliaceus TaxID=209559 RepID=A0A5N7BUX4_PETAA|nr:hypothetical protein BDV23DRAFT_188076 [Aspergillus alliaceus]
MSPDDFLPPSVHRLTDGQPLRSSGLNILNAPKLQVTLTNEPKLVPAADAPDLAAHKIFTDHMVRARWSAVSGWATPEIVPHGPLVLQPSASVFITPHRVLKP